jgi:hypothetical protein
VGLGIAAAIAGTVACVVFVAIGVALFFDWLVIRVDRTGITFRNLFWNRTIPIDHIEDVGLETVRPGRGNALPAVLMRTRNGKVRRIVAVRGGALSLYRTLLAVLRSESSL